MDSNRSDLIQQARAATIARGSVELVSAR